MRIGPSEPRIPSPAATAAGEATHPKAVQASSEPSPFARILHGLGNQIQSGENMMHNAVASAHDAGPADLIALQAGIYRYSESLDLASHLVENATTAAKTVLQGGGQ